MTFKEAVGILVSAAEVRMCQWQGVAEGKSPDDLVDELWESAGTGNLEAEAMAEEIEAAIEHVRRCGY